MKNKTHQQGKQYCQDCKRITHHIPKLDAVKNGQRVCDVCYRCNYFNDDSEIHTLPDRWVVLKLTLKDGKEPIYKVFASFYGGYLDGDSWKMNSGISSIRIDDNFIYFDGYSGSVYKCHNKESSYGTNSLANGVLTNMLQKLNESDVGTGEVLPFDSDWIKLLE